MKKSIKTSAVGTFFRPWGGRIFLICILMLVQSVLHVGIAFLSRFVIDAALYSTEKLLFWGCLLVGDILLLVAIHTLISWLAGSTMDRMVMELRGRLLRSAVYSRDVRLQQFHSGQLLSRGMEDVNAVCDGAINALPSLVGQISSLIAAFAAVVLISPLVAMVMAVAAAVIVAMTALLRPVLKKLHRRVRQADEKVMSGISENLQQLELLQGLQAQQEALRRFDVVQNSSFATRQKRRIWTVGFGSMMNVYMLTGSGALLLWGAVQVAEKAMTYGALTSMLQLFNLFRSPVLGLSGLWTRFVGVEVSAERLQEITQVPEIPAAVTNVTPVSVVFEHVTFSYPGEQKPVLEDFSGEFSLDQWVCLTGVSGKGKTTLFKLMLALYEPNAGRIYIRTETQQIPCSEATRSLFAYVPQDYALFSGTVLENLQLVGAADEKAVRKALEIAQADFVYSMPAGLETQVRENNTGLSKGQLQRLAIARALLMERPVLLLDECTSALDAGTESAVLQGLHRLGKKAILVTHRPEALGELKNVQNISISK